MINVYEGIKGVKKVKSLQAEDLQSSASNLGALPSGVTVLLSKNHVEFSVTLEGKRHQTDDVVWLGFHFSASFQKFQKVFSKSLQNPTFEQISNLLHKSLIAKFDDPYSSPLYITGANDSKAYWTVSLADNPQVIFGHIPLHRSDSFHTLQSYPILYLESDMQVIIGTDIDRNQLYPSYPKIDSLYTQTLYNIDPILQNHKWSANVIPSAKVSSSTSSTSPDQQQQQQTTTTTTTNTNNSNNNNNDQQLLLTKNQFDLEKLARWFIKKFNPVNPLTFVYGLSFFKKGSSKTVDMITLKSSPSGKSFVVNLVQTFRLQPQLDYFKDQEDQRRFESENLPAYTKLFTELEHDCQTIKNLVPSTSVSIYNPFFDKHTRRTAKIPSPLTVESSFLLNNNLQPTSSSSIDSESPRARKQPSQTNVKQQHQQLSSQVSTSSTPPLSSSTNSTNSINVDQELLANIIGKLIKQRYD